METQNVATHRRRSIRLPGYDYTQAGAYFVTICTQDRACLFGNIMDGKMVLNDAGEIAADCWTRIPDHFPHAKLDEWVVMPNHVHGIVMITDTNDGATVGADVRAKDFSPLPRRPAGTSRTIGSMVRGFKIGVTTWYRQQSIPSGIWQRNYWEHIVRNEPELRRIREYIRNNPVQWATDRLNVDVVAPVGAKNLSPLHSPLPPLHSREPESEYNREDWMI